MNQNYYATAWAVLGTFLFTFVFASGKLTGGEYSAVQILWLRYLSGCLLVYTIAGLSTSKLKSYRSAQPHWHLARAVCGASGGALMIHAATLIPIVEATAISLTEGLFAVVLAILILSEKVSVLHWLYALLCAAGALIVTAGLDSTVQFSLNNGALAALAGALLVAFESILIKTLSTKERPLSVLIYVNSFGVMLLALPAYLLWVSPPWWLIAGFLGLGPIAICAQYCWIRAFQLGDVSIVAPINYTWVIFAALLGIVWFDESLSVPTIIGTILICWGGIGLSRINQGVIKGSVSIDSSRSRH